MKKKDDVDSVKKEKDSVAAVLKEIEKALFAIRFYPVAVEEKEKERAVKALIKIHNKGNDTVRQMLLYMIHEALSKTSEFRVMHTQDYFKVRKPTEDPAQLRMSVYRAIFNYNTSLEGACELYCLLGKLNMDDAAKLLTYHYTRASTIENEGNHMIRAAIIDALGDSESRYALNALLEYARYADSDRSINRIVTALAEWDKKLDTMKLKTKEKEDLRSKLREVITKETGGTHYG